MAAKPKKNELLWAHKEKPQPPTYNQLGEFLMEAVRSGVEVRVRDALVKGADINYKCQAPTNPPIWNIGVMTPLMMATHRSDVTIIQLLLDKKADKSITNHLGKRAVDYAKTDAIKAMLA